MVLVMDSKLLQIASDMVGGSGVRVPVCVNTICMSGIDILLIKSIIFIKAVPTVDGAMTFLGADLTLVVEARPRSTTVVPSTTTTVATAASS
jgi:hypothetical protein